MRNPSLVLPVVVAAVLIVVGRANRRSRWGNWFAAVGYLVLVVTAAVAFMARA